MSDLWVVTDRSEPKYHQRLLDGEVLLFLLPNRIHHSLRNGEAACKAEGGGAYRKPDHMTSSPYEKLVVAASYFSLQLETK